MTPEEKILIGNEWREQSRTDPVVFIDRFFYTFDPRKTPPHLRFRLFDYQKDLVLEVKKAIEEGYDIFIDKSRDVGATYTTLATFLWFWRYVPGSNFLVGSRKEDYVDNRFGNKKDDEVSNKEESLFGKLDYMLRKLPSFMLPDKFDMKKHNGYMKLLNPENGNGIIGESSNADFSRSGRFKAILLDEFAFWDNDKQAWGSTADSTNCRIVLTTPGTRPSKAKKLRFGKDGEKIKVIEIDYKQDPRKTQAWFSREKERRSDEDLAREIQRNWEISIKGRVYDEIINIIKGNFPYNPDWPLYVSWDFGLDGTAIEWWQKNLNNGKKRLVESYDNSNKPIQFFFPLFGQPIDSLFSYETDDLDFITKVKVFKKAIHFGDPDVRKRAYQNKETVSTRQELAKVGIYVQTKPESNTYHIRRNATKVLLQNAPEINETLGNDYWIECMQNARYPERDENSQSTAPINEPIHDWTSHHRTSTEYFSVNYVDPVEEYVPPKTDISRKNWSLE